MARRKVSARTRQNKTSQAQKYEEWVNSQATPCVIARGTLNHMLKELEKDIRSLFQPLTFCNFHTFANQKFRDIAKALPQLKATHLVAMSETSNKLSYIKIARSPSGPTLTFRIEQYALLQDILSLTHNSSKVPQVTLGKDFFTTSHAFLITSGFSPEKKHQQLILGTLQNIFPTFDINDSDLKAFKRCAIFHIDPDTEEIDFRQYAVKRTQITDVKSFATVSQSKLFNMASFSDISEVVPNLPLKSQKDDNLATIEQQHEVLEDIDEGNNIDIDSKVSASNATSSTSSKPKFNIKLVEIGPRIKMRLVKIEEKFYEGNVLYHAFESPSEEKVAENEMKIEKRKELKKTRKDEIAQNVERKRVYTEGLSKRNNKESRKDRKVARKTKEKSNRQKAAKR